MSTVIHPVGPRRPETYWRRRAVALVVLVLAVVAVVVGAKAVVGALVGGDASPASAESQTQSQVEGEPLTAAPDAAPSAETSASTPAGPRACTAEQVSLVALSDATGYPLGATARLGMRITNTGEADCTMDAGSAALELTVVSGEDRIWSSDDCQESAQNVPTTVNPGEAGALESNVEWTLVRSAKDCATDLPPVKPGTYQLVARAGELTSAPLVFAIQ